MSTKFLACGAELRFSQFVSRFSRALDAALRAEGLSKANAAEVAGIHPSTVTRIMADEIQASSEHVESLLLVLTNQSDRLHCLREYLFDQTPEDYRESLVVSFGSIQEEKPRHRADPLYDALTQLEITATSDADLRTLITSLARATSKVGRKSFAANSPQSDRVASTGAIRKNAGKVCGD